MDTNQAVNTIREKLFALKDEKYAAFSASLVPNVERERFIGVRTPQLRALAKELCGTEEARLFTAALLQIVFSLRPLLYARFTEDAFTRLFFTADACARLSFTGLGFVRRPVCRSGAAGPFRARG